jgi:hypothetical protein
VLPCGILSLILSTILFLPSRICCLHTKRNEKRFAQHYIQTSQVGYTEIAMNLLLATQIFCLFFFFFFFVFLILTLTSYFINKLTYQYVCMCIDREKYKKKNK